MAFPLPPYPLILLKRAPQGPLWSDLPDHPQTLPRLCPDPLQTPWILRLCPDPAWTHPCPPWPCDSDSLPARLLASCHQRAACPKGRFSVLTRVLYSLQGIVYSYISSWVVLTLSAPFLISRIAIHTSALSLEHIYFHISYIDWILFEGSAPAAPLFTSYLLLSRLLLPGWSISRMSCGHRYQPRSPARYGWC